MTRGTLLTDTVPADCWEDAFPVGNGNHGALVDGQPGAERVIVTHHRLAWPDAPAALGGPPDLAGRLDRARDLLLTGDSQRALAVFGGDWPRYHPRPFHPAFTVKLTEDIRSGRSLREYRRTLSYRTGVAVTRWHSDEHSRRHTCFASRVRDLVVQHVRGDAPFDVAVTVDPRLPGAPEALRVTWELHKLAADDAVILTTVEYPPPALPGNGGYVGAVRVTHSGSDLMTETLAAARQRGLIVGQKRRASTGTDKTDTASHDKSPHTKHPLEDRGSSAADIAADDPQSRRDRRAAAVFAPQWHGIRASGCRELTLLARVELFSDAAGKAEARDRALAAVTAAPGFEPRLLLAEHARAHAAAFGEVALDLDVPALERRLPVSCLLDRQAAQPDMPLPALLEKLFDSGRYLLLSASGPLPPRLTGLWQGNWDSAWSGAITTDANLGLQLAGAVTTGVPQAVDAVANLIAGQLDDWRVNARRLFGTRGIVAPAHTDGISGLTTHFEPRWPLHTWTAAADWLLVPLLDEALARGEPGYATAHATAHATGDSTEQDAARATSDNAGQDTKRDAQYDTGYAAAEVADAALLELATFYEDFLVREDGDGHVVFAPSYSPENAPAGWAPAAVNATMDIAAARHALRAAARVPGAAPAAAATWNELADRLPPYRLTPDGALAEWAWPPEGTGEPPLPGDDNHRHVSHLYPVWPLHEITVAGTPALAAAALRALRRRGAQDDSAHGYLHKALAAARLRDGGLAGRLLAALTGQAFFFRSLMSSHYPKRSVYNADAACALPGLLAEMLVDSTPGLDETCPSRIDLRCIDLLPAVPAFLPSGRLRGARTLAGVRVVSLRWDAAIGEAEAVLESARGCAVEISCWGSAARRRVTLPAGTPVRLRWGSDKEVGDGDTR